MVDCWDGVNAAITRAAINHQEDPGVLLGILDALGFAATYNLQAERAQWEGNSAVFIGDFEISYDLTSLFDKVGLKGKVEKYATQKLGRKLARTIEKGGYSGEFQYQLQDFVVFTTGKASQEIQDALERLLRGPLVPDSLAAGIETAVMGKVDAIFGGWRDKVQASLSTGEFVGWTAEEITTSVIDKLLAYLTELTTVHYSVWSPIITVTVGPDGQLSATTEGSWANPFLSIKQER